MIENEKRKDKKSDDKISKQKTDILQETENNKIDMYDIIDICTDLNVIDNCIRTVEDRADLFILIIGGRYGHVVGDTETSEYKTARKKGIPTYIFVEERIISLAPIWRKNPDGDFSDVVDSNKVFKLVEDLSAEGKNWIFKFKNVQEITEKVDLLHILMNQGLSKAVGKPGESGDADYILYIAERVIDIYEAVKLLIIKNFLDRKLLFC